MASTCSSIALLKMGEKKNKEKKNGEEQKGNGGSKKEGNVTVVLKTDLHCEGCAFKVIRCIKAFQGVDAVEIGDGQKITVVGQVDPAKLREKVEKKTRKKVELVSPQPKKDKENNYSNSGKDGGGKEKNAGDAKPEKNKPEETPRKNKQEDKKENKEKKEKAKEPPITTAVLKVNLHCDGCIQKIYKTVTKTKGFQDMMIDKPKDLVTVTGSIEMKSLADLIQKQLKKDVQIVSPKKEQEKKDNGGGGREENGGEEKPTANKIMLPVGNPYPLGWMTGDQLHYNPNPYAVQFHPPQMFSDENPHACSVM